jgi:hypothetical protein
MVYQHCGQQGWFGPSPQTEARKEGSVKCVFFMVHHHSKDDNQGLPNCLVLQQLPTESGLDGRWAWTYGAKELPELAGSIGFDLLQAGFRLEGHRQHQVHPGLAAPPVNRYHAILQSLLTSRFTSFSAAWINSEELVQIAAHRNQTVQSAPFKLPGGLSHLALATVDPPAGRPFLFCAFVSHEYVTAKAACAST